ncbi:MAG: insulinase family protein, partial [Flavobacterium sp.]
VVVGKASEIASGLEKTKIPIFYFDKFGNPVKKVEEKKAAANVTVKSVVDKYIAAVGGEKALKAVKTLYSKSTATIQGMPMELTMIGTADGKMKVEMNGMGMTLMKQMVNEKGGYIEQQGQRKPLEGDRLKAMRDQARPFPELEFATKAGVTLLPIQSIEGKDAYGIKDGNKTYFYDVVTGLKVQSSDVEEVNGQPVSKSANYNDYREVKGVKIPFKVVMNVGFDIELNVSEVKVNEGVSDADFQ